MFAILRERNTVKNATVKHVNWLTMLYLTIRRQTVNGLTLHITYTA